MVSVTGGSVDQFTRGMSGRSPGTICWMRLAPEALAGHVLGDVTSSWHELDGRRSAEPVHVWLSVEELGTLRLHTLNGLVITLDEVDDSVEMAEYGRIVVERGAPTALNSRLGERIERVSRLVQQPPGATVGMLLHFRHHAVGIADLGDVLMVAEWSAADWSSWGLSIEPGR